MSTILVVDDEFAIVESLAELLDAEGYAVLTATDPETGLLRLAEATVDLILVDFMMPIMDGAEMIERVRGDPRYAGIKIVLMTAAPPPRPPQQPAWDHLLRKPFGIDELLDLLQELLPASS